MNVIVKTFNDSRVIADQCLVGNSLWKRFKGLLGKKSLKKSEAIWLKPCNGIHTFFMQFPIDVVYVDKDLRIVALYPHLKPWRFHLPHWKSTSVFEFASGTIEIIDLNIGDKLCIDLPSSQEKKRG